MSTTSTERPKRDFRDYDKDRMMRVATAMWAGMLGQLKDEQGAVYLQMAEVLDAMALLGGVMLSTWPDAKVPSKLREKCAEHGKTLADRTRQAIADPGSKSLFDVVLNEPSETYN